MTDKGLNLFDECAAECVYFSPYEEEQASLFLFISVKCTNSIPNSQIKINKNVIIAKVKILVGSDTVRHLKAFWIISNEMPV